MPRARFCVTGALAALGLALTFACSGPAPESPVDPGRSPALSAGPDVAAAIRAQERHTPALMARSGIVGTGVGLNAAGRPVIRIFLAHGAVAGVPSRLDDVPTERVVTGLFTVGSDPTTRARPAPVGFSIGHPDITAGTLGARVKNSAGVLYILSNNHVIANSNAASIGDPILQPGPYDGGTSADSVAWLSDFQTINFSGGNNTMDAGVARTVASNVGFATPTDDAYGAPSSQVFGDGNGDGLFDNKSQLLGLNVMKYGRTTGFTTDQISEINVTVSVCYQARGPFNCVRAAMFSDQIGIASESFSAGGDSGSLIVSQSGRNPVGLLFAGSSTRTLANRVDLVLDRFDVTVDDGSGGGGTTNSPPTASFGFNCTGLACQFDGTGSSDGDGNVVSWAWTFGDGTSGSGSTGSHTYAASDTYTVTLTVTDDDGATDSDTQSVTVSGGGGGTTMHVGDLDRTSVNNGSSWTAQVTIRVHDGSHAAVAGAAVSGSWSNGATGTASCTTGSTGACTVSSGSIPKRNSSALFSVTGVGHASLTYAPAANHDPDGDSNGTSITVLKP
jgi:PKD repeat protein